MEKWVQIRDHPNYSVSNLGRVRNDVSGEPIKATINQKGLAQVKLGFGDGRFTNRGLAFLVANTFLDKPNMPTDTAVNLNGDRLDCRAANLAWRPRWFAYKYHRQFKVDYPYRIHALLENLNTGERFASSYDAAIYYGLLESEVVQSVHNRTYVLPTYHEFAIIE